jgi:hypothetical protein
MRTLRLPLPPASELPLPASIIDAERRRREREEQQRPWLEAPGPTAPDHRPSPEPATLPTPGSVVVVIPL